MITDDLDAFSSKKGLGAVVLLSYLGSIIWGLLT